MKTSDKKLSPLEKLRIEKAELKEECAVQEKEMTSRFSYIYENLGAIIGNALLHDITKRFGFVTQKPKSQTTQDADAETPPSSTIKQTVMNGLQITYPYIKEFVQPIVVGVIVGKLRSMFSPKKKIEGGKKK